MRAARAWAMPEAMPPWSRGGPCLTTCARGRTSWRMAGVEEVPVLVEVMARVMNMGKHCKPYSILNTLVG